MGQAEGEIQGNSEVERLINWVNDHSICSKKEVRRNSLFGETCCYRLVKLKMPLGYRRGNTEQANAKMELKLKRGLGIVKDFENG